MQATMNSSSPLSRRKFLKNLTAMGLLPCCGLLGNLQQALAANTLQIPQGIISLRGKVTVNGLTASKGTLVKAGYTVHTAKNSEVIYVIENNAFLQHEESVVEFGVDALTHFMRVFSGRILSVFGNANKSLHVPTAVIGLRGTACHLGVEPDKTYLCLCYGEVEVTLTDPSTLPFFLKASHHDHPVYLHAQRNLKVEPADMLDHQDDELKLLEALVGRIPPFIK